MRTVPFPEELRARWADILKAAADVGGWAGEYSHGYIQADEGDFPLDPPAEVPLWDRDEDDASWAEWPHRDMYASMRHVGDNQDVDVRGREYPEFHFGTYAVFRVTREESAIMNEGYEDTAGTENERIIEDDDHVIVVYML